MAFITFVQVFLVVFLIMAVVLFLVRRFLPWRAAKGRVGTLVILFTAALLGYWQGTAQILSWADNYALSIKEKGYRPNDVAYLLYDVMPALKNLRAPIPAAVWEAVDLVAAEGPPCARVQAHELRGRDAGPELAADCEREKEKTRSGAPAGQ